MKTLHQPGLVFVAVFILLVISPFPTTIVQPIYLSATPTYDPLVEPLLPEHPSEYELGRNLYWHWCMTCHGDRGQGLTDEFRGIWEPDHQNCWGRGCHAGHPGDLGFPIPTVVPALVSDSHLARFESLQGLSDFLQATHPPQSPGILKDEEYHAIALFVFTMNDRSTVDPVSINTPLPTATAIVAPRTQPSVGSGFPIYAVLVLVVLLVAGTALLRKTDLPDTHHEA